MKVHRIDVCKGTTIKEQTEPLKLGSDGGNQFPRDTLATPALRAFRYQNLFRITMTIEELKQHRYAAVRILDLDTVLTLTNQIRDLERDAKKLSRRSEIAKEGAEAIAVQEITDTDTRIAILLSELGIGLVGSTKPTVTLNEYQRSLYERGFWRSADNKIRNVTDGNINTYKAKLYANDNVVSDRTVDIYTRNQNIFVVFDGQCPHQRAVCVASLTVKEQYEPNEVYTVLRFLAGCFDYPARTRTNTAVILPSYAKKHLIKVLKEMCFEM